MSLATELSPPTAERSTVARSVLMRVALQLVMPLTDLPVAIFAFVFTVTGLSISASLLPVFLAGIPVFLLFAACARTMANVERKRMRLFLDIDIPAVGRPRGLRASLTDGPTWRAIAYQVLHLPLAILTFSLSVSAWATSLALISMPAWLEHVPSRHADLWVLTVSDQRTAWLIAVAGVALGALGVAITIGLTAAEGAFAQALLGVSAAQLSQRVDQLQGSRARVVDATEAERRRIERDLHDGA